MDENMQSAVNCYMDRQSRKYHPDGKFDRGNRWYPSDNERRDCCKSIRSPSRSYPWSLMTHCRTATHIAHLFGVDEKELKKVIREANPPQREGGIYYKKVAISDDGRLFSIFDGETEYVLGTEMRETARQQHNGGFYVYKTINDAKLADFPYGSALEKAPHVIISVACDGQYCRYDNGKLAFSHITPLEIVE